MRGRLPPCSGELAADLQKAGSFLRTGGAGLDDRTKLIIEVTSHLGFETELYVFR